MVCQYVVPMLLLHALVRLATCDPTITVYSPDQDAANVPTDTSIVLTFDDQMQAGTAGGVTLAPAGGVSVAIQAVGSPAGSITYTTSAPYQITISPSAAGISLSSQTLYTVTIGSTAFRATDPANTAYFPGLSGTA